MIETAATERLAAAVLDRLRELGLQLAVAESCTGGDLVSALTRAEGASDVVWGGAVVYTAAAKTVLAGVNAGLVAERGVVSPEVTLALADGIRRRAGVGVGVAVTGWAGPSSAGPDAVGTVYLGVAAPATTRSLRVELPGGRPQVRAAAVRALLELLLEILDEDPPVEGGQEP